MRQVTHMNVWIWMCEYECVNVNVWIWMYEYECVNMNVWVWMCYVMHMNASHHKFELVSPLYCRLQRRVSMRHASHMNVSWYAYECVTSHIRTCRTVCYPISTPSEYASCQAWECVMSQMWMRQTTHLNMYELLLSYVNVKWIWFMSHVYESVMSHIYECVMSHMRVRHSTNMNVHGPVVSPDVEWVGFMSHMRMCHVTRMSASCHTVPCHAYERVISHIWHVSMCSTFVNSEWVWVTSYIYRCVM